VMTAEKAAELGYPALARIVAAVALEF